MANLVEQAKRQIDELLAGSLARAAEKGQLPSGAALAGTVEVPKDVNNGDFAANHAMAGARALHMAPRKIAEALIENLELDGSYFASAEAAGPGFINFRLAPKWYGEVLTAVRTEGAAYGRSKAMAGQKVMVEFVSANPTGPMHMGNARGGVLGDTLAEVLSRAGADVWREFYVNDAGNQIEKFSSSIDVADTVSELTKRGFTYEKDGALWLATSRILGDGLRAAGKSEKDIEKLDLKDDVLRRANGFYTYFAADIAYHRNKLAVRGFDRVINIWGADHHGHVARLKGALDALGLDGQHRLDIVLMQLVKLLRDGEVVRMSKRTGKAISLGDLLDEIPVDAARWFFNSRPDTQMDFDLGLAVREDSENPVYYVQYAHARICSVIRNLAADGHRVPGAADIDASLLNTEQERELIKQLAALPDEMLHAAQSLDPSRINRYAMELAARFHRFYNACRIRGAEPSTLEARLLLADCSRSAIALCLSTLGVHAPEQM